MSGETIHEWDGAYVLGALSPSDRQEFESHLAECRQCRTAIGQLAPLPGLLARADLAALESDIVPPEDLEERLLAAARPLPLWRRTTFRVGAAVAVGVAAAVLLAVTLVPRTHQPHGVEVALAPVAQVPLSASVRLHPASWGTRVDMTCVYAAAHYGSERAYTLWVVGGAGRAEQVSAWHAGPGETSRTQGSTDLGVGQIKRIELRAASGQVLLSAPV